MKYKMITQFDPWHFDLSFVTVGELLQEAKRLDEKYGSDAVIEYSGDTDDFIRYERTETDKERKDRLTRARKIRENRKQEKIEKEKYEREMYERLKEKFES